MLTAAQATLDNLLASITYDTWWEYLPLISDAYRDAGMWDEGEAVGEMISGRWIPDVDVIGAEYRWTAFTITEGHQPVSRAFRNWIHNPDYGYLPGWSKDLGLLLTLFVKCRLAGLTPTDPN